MGEKKSLFVSSLDIDMVKLQYTIHYDLTGRQENVPMLQCHFSDYLIGFFLSCLFLILLVLNEKYVITMCS